MGTATDKARAGSCRRSIRKPEGPIGSPSLKSWFSQSKFRTSYSPVADLSMQIEPGGYLYYYSVSPSPGRSKAENTRTPLSGKEVFLGWAPLNEGSLAFPRAGLCLQQNPAGKSARNGEGLSFGQPSNPATLPPSSQKGESPRKAQASLLDSAEGMN